MTIGYYDDDDSNDDDNVDDDDDGEQDTNAFDRWLTTNLYDSNLFYE